MRSILGFICIYLLFCTLAAARNEVIDVRLGIHSDKTRLVIDLTMEGDYSLSKSTPQGHYQVTLHNCNVDSKYFKKTKGKAFISQYYFTPGLGKNQILHIETKGETQIDQIFRLDKRLVIDIKPKLKPSQKKTLEQAILSNILLPSPLPSFKKMDRITDFMPQPAIKPIKYVVVIDAGHGGQDPGTTSPEGVLEKDITLAVAKLVQKELEKNSSFMAVLTREKDQFLPLRKRFAVAREAKADLLISLHADSNPNKTIKGLAVYTLSEHASDKEAERLAEKENTADFLADLKYVQAEEQDVSNILINLSQTRSKNHAIAFADCLMQCFDKDEVLSKNTHRSADFAVLKAPDVASVLIELGYLSNPRDRKRLVMEEYQRKIASCIAKAIDNYFEHLKS